MYEDVMRLLRLSDPKVVGLNPNLNHDYVTMIVSLTAMGPSQGHYLNLVIGLLGGLRNNL